MQTVTQSCSVIQDLTNIFRNFYLVAVIISFILQLKCMEKQAQDGNAVFCEGRDWGGVFYQGFIEIPYRKDYLETVLAYSFQG